MEANGDRALHGKTIGGWLLDHGQTDHPPTESDTANTCLIESGNPLPESYQTCGTNR